MSLIWLIIKVILIILLSLLGIVVLLGLILLVAPIRYEVYLEKYGDLCYEMKFRYLQCLRGYFHLEDGHVHHQVLLFRKTLYELKKEPKVVSNEEAKTLQEEPKVTYENEGVFEVKETVTAEPTTKRSQTQQVVKIKDEKVAKPRLVHEVKEETIEVGQDIKEDTKEAIQEDGLALFKEYVLNKEFGHLLKCIVRLCIQLVRYIAPDDWSFEVIVGKEDPADTGELMAKLIMLYPLYYRHGNIVGDYEKEGIRGGCLASGKFRLMGILIYLLKFLLHKVTRDYIKLILRIRKEEANGR